MGPIVYSGALQPYKRPLRPDKGLRWLLCRPADMLRGPSDLPRGPSMLARGPFGMFRGPFDSSRGPFGLIRGPSDQYRGPLNFSGALWSVQDPLACSVVLSTWKGTALAALSPCRHAQGPLRPPQGPLRPPQGPLNAG